MIGIFFFLLLDNYRKWIRQIFWRGQWDIFVDIWIVYCFFSYNIVIVAIVPIYVRILTSSIDTNCFLSPIMGYLRNSFHGCCENWQILRRESSLKISIFLAEKSLLINVIGDCLIFFAKIKWNIGKWSLM